MSLKRRIENQYQNLVYSLQTISLPDWFNSSVLKASLSTMVIVLSFFYLLQINATATSGYEIHRLEKQAEALSAEIQKLEISVASESAMPNIQKRLKGINMVAAQDINYINVSAAIARR